MFALAKMHDEGIVNDFEYIVVYSYFTTDLVHKTIAERITIEDDVGNIRYMSKQNVHQNIMRRNIDKIIEYVKTNMPAEFKTYFPNAHEKLLYDEQLENELTLASGTAILSGQIA